MFEAFKVIVKGWQDQRRYSGVPPLVSQPYLQVVAAFLDQRIPYGIAMKQVATHVDDVTPFALTYTTMPFVVAGVCADNALGRESSAFEAVLGTLKYHAGAYHAKGPDVEVGEGFILDADREVMFQHFRGLGYAKEKHKLLNSAVSRSDAAAYMVDSRTTVLAAQVPECLVAGRWTDAGVSEFASTAGSLFAYFSTRDVTPAKERVFQLTTKALMIAFISVQK